MDRLREKSDRLLGSVQLDFQRDLLREIKWDWRLISLLGARGVGKTTLLLQRMKMAHGMDRTALYATLDDIYFTDNRLADLADTFFKTGGRVLYLDEVHKYPSWAREIKNLYDTYPELRIVFTGSSIVELLKQEVDLSRRALLYELHGLSFREYLQLKAGEKYEVIDLKDLLQHHRELAAEIVKRTPPFEYFGGYLEYGYYPFFLEGEAFYKERLEQAVRLVIESDLDFIPGYDPRNARKIYQLFYILASNVPFKPNVSKLSDKIGVHRNTLVQYLHHLQRARLINTLYPAGHSISTLQKPEKIFLQNTNIAYAIAPQVDQGSLRETFLFTQLQGRHHLSLPKRGDFLIDDTVTLEVGGAGKKKSQIREVLNAYLALDGIETGEDVRIPLWLFGFCR
ncbi:MAG: AAA family ATPase [bacterium]|nr:AAA family ATPase [bacterium]